MLLSATTVRCRCRFPHNHYDLDCIIWPADNWKLQAIHPHIKGDCQQLWPIQAWSPLFQLLYSSSPFRAVMTALHLSEELGQKQLECWLLPTWAWYHDELQALMTNNTLEKVSKLLKKMNLRLKRYQTASKKIFFGQAGLAYYWAKYPPWAFADHFDAAITANGHKNSADYDAELVLGPCICNLHQWKGKRAP